MISCSNLMLPWTGEFRLPQINRPYRPWNFMYPRPDAISVANVSNIASVSNQAPVEERPKFKWVDIGPKNNPSDEQSIAISQLPKNMTKRCKALMRQIICFSAEKGSLLDLLAGWVRIMRPKRADWLVVLKHLSTMDHPLYLQVLEFALSEESFEANIRDYTKIIHLFAKQGRLQDAENTMLSMQHKAMMCDQVTLTTMIHMYSKAGNFKQAEEIFLQMKLLDQPLDRRSYGSMIMAYIRAGMPEKGEALLIEMENLDIYAGREVYKALLRAYSTRGECEGAQRVFDAVQLAGTRPDSKLCALLINAYVVAGHSQSAEVAFSNMQNAGVEPSDKCVALLLAGYEKDNRLDTALELLLKLEVDGIMVGKESSEVLARWFRRLGVVEEVAQVLKEYATA